jgi:hypothetical protein
MGGAIANRGDMVIHDSFFSGNSVNSDKFESSGGALWSETSDIVVINSTFTGNSANGSADEVNGGAVAQNRMTGAHHYIHCTIVGNHTDGDGGALSIKAFVASTHALIVDDGNFVQSTVLATNTGGDCSQTNAEAISRGHNLSDDDTCTSWAGAAGIRTG